MAEALVDVQLIYIARRDQPPLSFLAEAVRRSRRDA
jgi:hypothetical protein